MSTTDKFGPGPAERWSEEAYADPAAYLRHRADLVRSLGPPLEPGDIVLDLACGDGGLAAHLLPHGLSYLGVDASAAMVAAARARLGARAEIVHAELDDYRPREPVAATTVFRALYYTRNRAAFFRHVASFTQTKLVFDLNPRSYAVEQVRAELRAAGFDRLELRPFFVPQRIALPRALRRLLVAAERSGSFAAALLRVRFSYVCAASRSER